MAFKSEIHVAELASIRTGHTEGDIYYILDNGMLGDLPCKPGDFVKWHNDTWQIQPDEHYALASVVDGEIAQAIDNVLDDGSASESIVVAIPSSQSDDYAVGNYYEVQGKVARLRTKTDGDNVTQLTFDTTSGLLDAMNGIVEDITLAVFHFTGTTYPNAFDIAEAVIEGKSVILIDDNNQRVYYLMSSTVYSASSLDSLKFYSFDKYNIKVLENSNGAVWDTSNISVGAVKLGNRLTDAASINVPNNALSTLNTAQSALTLNVNVGGNEVPNFAVEITPSVDVTLTVTKTVDNTVTTLNPSAAGGNSLTTGKLYQVTCVGSCWTLAEFAMPS